MTSQPDKAQTWKRAVVLILGLFFVVVAVALFCFGSDSTSSKFAKFTLLPAICIGGVWLVITSLRGRAADVNQTADRFTFRR